MQTKKLTKFAFIIIAILFITLLTTGGSVQAALQSNPSVHYKKTDKLMNWIPNIRKMEATGGAMGLTETIGTNLVSTTSNNIDVHCMKGTEYGAIAILSTSGYGNPDKIPTSGEGSTTGNNTGILIGTSKWEWVVAMPFEQYVKDAGVNTRYYNLYTSYENKSPKVGDALGTATTTNPGCRGWHSASSSTWPSSYYGQGFVRGYGGLFSYAGANYSVDDRECLLS